jgi:DNA polymerase III subunit alpha
MAFFKFPCGCQWPIVGESGGDIPLLDLNVDNAPEDCQATWDLLGRGDTKGVFQLESALGRQWTKKLKPNSLEHMSALGALLRPGCLKNLDEDGVSTTMHYILRKNGKEDVSLFHPVIDKILSDTYGTMIYQEQAIRICVDAAGFSEQEADMMRKAIGKKDTAEMARLKKLFMEKSKAFGVLTQPEAEEIFSWIEKSQRYSFNHSHAACYGVVGYRSAYLKAHHPLAFFTAWLKNAKSKQDPQQEIFELVNDAKLFGVTVEPPDLSSKQQHFHTNGKVIKFGLLDIKGMGSSQLNKVFSAVEKHEKEFGKEIGQWSWHEFLVGFSSSVPDSSILKLIHSGALGWMKVPRSVMEAEFKSWSSLTVKEQEWSKKNFDGQLTTTMKSLARPKKEGGGVANVKRVEAVKSLVNVLEKPAYPIVDTPMVIAANEESLLGISLTFSRVDSCDVNVANCTCKEFLTGKAGAIIIAAEVKTVRQVTTKKGKNPGQKMAFLSLSDGTSVMEDVVCFPDVWLEYKDVLREESLVVVQGERDNKEKGSRTFIVKKAWSAKLPAD